MEQWFFKDSYTGLVLLRYYVKNETNRQYIQGVNKLKLDGFNIVGIVCDGRRGLLQSFEKIPVQMCQFHQVAIITRYLTTKPKVLASIELKALVELLTSSNKEVFSEQLLTWYLKWKSYLDERTTNEITGKSYYTHKRLRSAYRSLNTNLKWLFVWQENPKDNMPNTTNALEGLFSDLKTKMRVHNGLSIQRKKKFIDEFFKA